MEILNHLPMRLSKYLELTETVYSGDKQDWHVIYARENPSDESTFQYWKEHNLNEWVTFEQVEADFLDNVNADVIEVLEGGYVEMKLVLVNLTRTEEEQKVRQILMDIYQGTYTELSYELELQELAHSKDLSSSCYEADIRVDGEGHAECEGNYKLTIQEGSHKCTCYCHEED